MANKDAHQSLARAARGQAGREGRPRRLRLRGRPSAATRTTPRRLAANLARLTDLQERIYAEAKHAVLIVLQGIDAAGKDGTIKVIAGAFNPQGTPVTSFKEPTPKELAHDFLWRVHAAVPGKGEIGIFNRSHYEQVLIVRVHKLEPEDAWRRHYGEIRDWERMLTDEGVTILKFFLAIDKDDAAPALPGPRRRSDQALEVLRWPTWRSASSGTTTGPLSRTCWPRRAPTSRPGT